MQGHAPVVEILLSARASTALRNADGQTPAELAFGCRDAEPDNDSRQRIVDLLTKASQSQVVFDGPVATDEHTEEPVEEEQPSVLEDPVLASTLSAKESISSPTSARKHGYRVGAKVSLGPGMDGIIRFVGTTKFAPGLWFGVELSLANGRNDGSVGGVTYFRCAKNHGTFTQISRLSLTGNRVEPFSLKTVKGLKDGMTRDEFVLRQAILRTGTPSSPRGVSPHPTGSKPGTPAHLTRTGSKPSSPADQALVAKSAGKFDSATRTMSVKYSPAAQPIPAAARASVANISTARLSLTSRPSSVAGSPTTASTNLLSRTLPAPSSSPPKEGLSRSNSASSLAASPAKQAATASARAPSLSASIGPSTPVRTTSTSSLKISITPASPDPGHTAVESPAPDAISPAALKAALTKAGFKVGEIVTCSTNGKEGAKGTVRFIGTASFDSGLWIGIELRDPIGRHDGIVQGQRYFKCNANYGAMVRANKVLWKSKSLDTYAS
eukprot:m.69051 g.69051  ORF g.69051 m.69051 type:complete len:496 (+) comp50031_c0_seq1:561-2048(+)